jgi:hypothetical protein
MTTFFSKTIMKSNRLPGIFNRHLPCQNYVPDWTDPPDKWQLFKRYRLFFLAKTRIYFCTGRKIPRRRSRTHYTKKHWYILNCQTATLTTDTTHGKWNLILPCFYYFQYFDFWIKFPPILKYESTIMLKCLSAVVNLYLLYAILFLKRPTHS